EAQHHFSALGLHTWKLEEGHHISIPIHCSLVKNFAWLRVRLGKGSMSEFMHCCIV
ncbi:UNVERIFIED_CONTAM: hypothetical protein Sindi_2524700, partial [Sesamum indicum]